MYISFSDAPGEGFGGAAQGIIPVQDAEGNMLGGSAPASPQLATEVKKEARSVRTEMNKMEDHFDRMMAAVERNTEKVAELADKQSGSVIDNLAKRVSEDSGSNYGGGDSAVGVLSGHFVRMNELLSKNSNHMEALAKKHYDNEQKLRQTMETLASKQTNDHLDMRQLSSHLDRIQAIMEASIKERKDSAREISEQQSRPTQIDFSPLTERLEKVQDAVEQNSGLIKALLDEGGANSDSKPGTPFWGKDQPTQPDFLPLTQHLQRIHDAIGQQSEHMKALVGFASGENEAGGDGAAGQSSDKLAPLGEHLEQIYNAIEEGNKHARGSPAKVNLGPLGKHLEALRQQSERNNDHMQQLLDAQTATREAVEANGGEIDFTPMAEHLEAIRESSNTNAETIKSLLKSQEATRRESSVDFTPLKDHLDAVRNASEKNSEQIRKFVESQQTSAKSSPRLDLTPLADRLNRIHTILEKQANHQSQGTGDTKFLMSALTSHLSKIQGVTDQNAQHVKALREKQSSSQDKMHIAVSETSEQVRLLLQRNEENEARIDAQNSQMRELMSGQREMVEVMRQLARSVVAQNKGSCDHVVVPPPRKMGRKVVGFVYDAKEGTP